MSDKNISNFPDYGPYHDYPNEPIGGGNPYWKCSSCGASDPHINGTLSKHFSGLITATSESKIFKKY